MVGACGGKPVTPKPATASEPTGKIEPASCGDAAVILSQDQMGDDTIGGGRGGRITAITKMCTSSKWPRAVLDCVGASPVGEATTCLEHLSEMQQVSWQELLGRWASYAVTDPGERIPSTLMRQRRGVRAVLAP